MTVSPICLEEANGADTAAGENATDAGGFILDPGGGENLSAGRGKIFYPEVTDDWMRKNPEGGQDGSARGGKIKDSGGGETIDLEGRQLKLRNLWTRWW